MSRQPDYNVVLQKKTQNNERGPSARVGAAWTNSKDGINVAINVPVILMPGWSLVLWPNDRNGGSRAAPSNDAPHPADEFGDDDIPF